MGDGDSALPVAGWELMATAPRDYSLLIVRLGPARRLRKHDQHIVRWDGSGSRGFWRSYTARGILLREDRCVGWRPLDEAGREFLNGQRALARKRRGARIALG